jgi:GNAT superfamily N-acetyltransferase
MRGPDDLDVWAILCLFVSPEERRSGLSVQLIDAACRHAFEHGAPAVEAYPVVPRRDEVPAVFASQGILSAYRAAGFEVVGRPSETRAVVRRHAPG